MDATKTSALEKLIGELCPEGVEYRMLSELFKTKNGYTPSKGKKEFWENGTIPWFRMDDIRQNGGILSRALQNVTEKAVKGELFPENSLIVATTATIGEHALITVPSLANQQFTCLSLKEEYKNQFVIKFLYYYCFKLDEYCKKNLNQGSLASVDRGKFSKFKFPLPPLPIQQEIVRILDTFTNLTAELTNKLNAELTARRKQYEYYRDELLTFGEDVEYKTLPEISINCDRQRKPVTKGKRNSGSYPYYGASGIVDYVSDYIFEGDYLLISEDGANLLARSSPIAFSISGKNWVNNHAHVLKFETDVMRKYVEIYLNSISLERYISGGAQPKLNQDNLNKIPIPVPENHQIQTIVEILTKFDRLCNDLGSGIPAEISARQKQYEYYRDQLLSFQKEKK